MSTANNLAITDQNGADGYAAFGKPESRFVDGRSQKGIGGHSLS
jgi:hypothetical protein